MNIKSVLLGQLPLVILLSLSVLLDHFPSSLTSVAALFLGIPLAPLADPYLCLYGRLGTAALVVPQKLTINFILYIEFFSLACDCHTQWRSIFVESWQCLYFYSVACIQDFSFPPWINDFIFIFTWHNKELTWKAALKSRCLLIRFQRGKAQDGCPGHHNGKTEIRLKYLFIAQQDLKMPLTPGWDKRNLCQTHLE